MSFGQTNYSPGLEVAPSVHARAHIIWKVGPLLFPPLGNVDVGTFAVVEDTKNASLLVRLLDAPRLAFSADIAWPLRTNRFLRPGLGSCAVGAGVT